MNTNKWTKHNKTFFYKIKQIFVCTALNFKLTTHGNRIRRQEQWCPFDFLFVIVDVTTIIFYCYNLFDQSRLLGFIICNLPTNVTLKVLWEINSFSLTPCINKNFVSAFVNKAYQLIKCQMMRVDTLLIEMKYIAM